MHQTRQQKHAQIAYEKISRHREQKYLDGYGRQAHKLPILLRSSGLVAALEFIDTRNERDGGAQLVADLNAHAAELKLIPQGQCLKEVAMKADLAAYLRLSREVQQIATWYKRFSVSVLEIEQGSE